MVDFGESDKMIMISEKVDKSNIYNWFNGNISFFIHRTSSDSVDKERSKPVVSVWCIHFSTYSLSLSLSLYIIYIYIYIGTRVFNNGPGGHRSNPGPVIPNTQKVVLDATLSDT